MTEEIAKEIQNLTQKIVKEYKPEKIILFGSYAWGKPDKSSDVDFFIVKESKKERRFRTTELEEILERTGEGHKLPTDILVYTPTEVKERISLGDFFVKRIFNEGKVLYGTK